MDKHRILIPLIFLIVAVIPVSATSDIHWCALCHANIANNFTKSLHYTINGIINGWEQGAGKDFNMPPPKLCYKCHIGNCSRCHIYHKFIPNMTTCIDCHEHNIGVNYIGYLVKKMKKGPSPDVHYLHNLTCMDCHGKWEIHGDGHNYTFAWYAVKVRCLTCHGNESVVVKGMKPKQYDPNLLPHRIHKNLSCFACHAVWYQTCRDCHLNDGKIANITTSEFHVLMGPNGKIYPACIMSVVYDGKRSTAVGIVMPHTISAKARPCSACHSPGNTSKVFLVGFEGHIIGPPGTKLANPPDRLIFKVPILNIWIDSEKLGTLIIGATLLGILVHYLKRKITMGGE